MPAAMECGLVGLPGSGKTSLFNALTWGHQTQAEGPGKHGVGVAALPDGRLRTINRFIETKKVTPATITFVDIAGFAPGIGAEKINLLLDRVRRVDALCEVVRCFPLAGVPADPARDISTFEDELLLADLAIVESALEKARRPARTGEAAAKARVTVLEKVLAALEAGRPARSVGGWTAAEEVLVRGYGLSSAKRILYVANVSEDDLAGSSEAAAEVRRHAESAGGEFIAVCAELEAEIARLPEADQAEMLAGLGLSEPAVEALGRAVCRLLGLVIFYTAGPKEIRAWTVAADATAPQAAGVIHTDLERGFIRAECYFVDDLVELGSEKAIKAAGRLRVEGKNYRLRDGDVIHVLFSV